MLVHLTIRNYALISHLEIDPSAKLNVVTGETGAGKSIMLGAIGLLLGNRADTRVLWDDSDKCIIEGVFDISAYPLRELFEEEGLDHQEQTLIRREIGTNGKSRAFVNDTPVTLDVLKKIGSRLMDVHSQHETLELGSRHFQLQLIDIFSSNKKIVGEYAKAWAAFQSSKREYEKLKEEALQLKKESDFVQFQLQELVKADLSENELESAESELKIMENAEDIKTRFNQVLGVLHANEFSVQASLSEVRNLLGPVSSLTPSYEQIYNRLEAVRIELSDILSEIEKEEENVEFDPRRTQSLTERLNIIYRLLQKHQVAHIRELLAVQADLQAKADKTTNLDGLLEKSKQDFQRCEKEVYRLAKDLSASREKSFAPLCSQITRLLKSLGIPEVQIKIERENIDPGPSGADSVEVYFSAPAPSLVALSPATAPAPCRRTPAPRAETPRTPDSNRPR